MIEVAWLSIKANWRIFAAAGVALALLGVLWAFGAHERGIGRDGEKRAEAARLVAAQKLNAKREVKAQAITDTAKTQIVAERVRIQTVTKTLIEKVPVYVTAKADADCTVPLGFVRLHDAAAAGSAGLPSASGGSIDTPSGVPLSAVASTVVANYGTAWDWRAEALGWRDWYVKQKAAWDGK